MVFLKIISYVICNLNQLEFRFNMLREDYREFFIKKDICEKNIYITKKYYI